PRLAKPARHRGHARGGWRPVDGRHPTGPLYGRHSRRSVSKSTTPLAKAVRVRKTRRVPIGTGTASEGVQAVWPSFGSKRTSRPRGSSSTAPGSVPRAEYSAPVVTGSVRTFGLRIEYLMISSSVHAGARRASGTRRQTLRSKVHVSGSLS